MIIASDICLTLGQKTIFDHLSFAWTTKHHIGLVGRNGQGKTTLLKAIANQMAIDSGTISIERDKTIAYLPQNIVFDSTKTILEEAISTFDFVHKLNEEIASIEKRLETEHDNHDLLEHYAHLCQKQSHLNPGSYAVQAKLVLQGLGFGEESWNRSVNEFSAGWRMRLVLAKLLLQDADFYLFDEPTNHLDIISKDWFLEFLKNSKKGFALVSHDRYFLDHACTSIFEIDRGNGTMYTGNYASYEKQKEAAREMQQRMFDQQQRELKQKIATVERFKAKANKASMAQSMLKKIEKIEKIEAPEGPPPTMNLPFSHITQSGKIVLTVTDVSKSFGSRRIFSHASFEVTRHQRVALVAANGVGKSTLLSIIMGKLQADSGSIVLGHNAAPALFEQEQDQILNKSKTVLDEVTDVCTTSETRQKVRAFLGAFLFPGDDVHKKISVLSGGEKNRVAMVKVLLAQANFLILDEPTNHLDLPSKKALLEALKQFPGTILFVSHDRAFLDDLATTIVELTPQGTITYQGNYESFLYSKAQKASQTVATQPVLTQKHATGAKPQEPAKLTGKEAYEMRKKISAAEKKVEKLEAQLALLREELTTFDYNSTKNLAELKKKIETTEADIKTTFALWEELSKKV